MNREELALEFARIMVANGGDPSMIIKISFKLADDFKDEVSRYNAMKSKKACDDLVLSALKKEAGDA